MAKRQLAPRDRDLVVFHRDFRDGDQDICQMLIHGVSTLIDDKGETLSRFHSIVLY